MKKIVQDAQTGEKVLLDLSPEEVSELQARKAAHDADIAANGYKHDRIFGTEDDEGNRLTEGYPPIGDQLDAIWKQLNKDRLDGKSMIQEADDLLSKINAVKAAHPKGGA